jgi:hypothetical protein
MIQPYPQPYTVTSIETKALCAVLRKAETGGERAIVEKMIEICDPQSGLRFEDLWDWWKEHKAQDIVKFNLQQFQQRVNLPYDDPNRITVTC